MPDLTTPSTTMAPHGDYNRNARVQSRAAAFALPLLERAAREASLPAGQEVVVVADYGSATGQNSVAPVETMIRTLRAREDRAVLVVHQDQPENDWATLFRTIRAEPDGYLRTFDRVQACAAVGSFYEPTLPPGSVSVGWSAAAAHWLSRAPATLQDHLWAPTAASAGAAPFLALAREDWSRFLGRRADELRGGGRMVVVVATVDDDGVCGGEHVLDGLARAVQALVSSGTLTRDEQASMVVPIFCLSRADLEAPFAGTELRGRLRLVEHARATAADPLWSAIEATGDAAAFARSFTGWVRAFSEVCLFGALARPPAERRAVADRAYATVEEEVRDRPESARAAWRVAALSLVKV